MTTKLTSLLACIMLATLMNLPAHADKPALAPDLIITNAVVHIIDPSRPVAEAVAIHGNRIVAVGKSDEIKKLAGSNTRTIDAKKRLLQLNVPARELAARRKKWKPPKPRYTQGLLAKYRKLVSSASQGAVTDR